MFAEVERLFPLEPSKLCGEGAGNHETTETLLLDDSTSAAVRDETGQKTSPYASASVCSVVGPFSWKSYSPPPPSDPFDDLPPGFLSSQPPDSTDAAFRARTASSYASHAAYYREVLPLNPLGDLPPGFLSSQPPNSTGAAFRDETWRTALSRVFRSARSEVRPVSRRLALPSNPSGDLPPRSLSSQPPDSTGAAFRDETGRTASSHASGSAHSEVRPFENLALPPDPPGEIFPRFLSSQTPDTRIKKLLADPPTMEEILGKESNRELKDKSTPQLNSAKAGKGFDDLRCCLDSIYSPMSNEHVLRLRVDWELHEAVPQYRKGTRISAILAITGDEMNAQAATCGAYMQEHFQTGSNLLCAIQGAWDSRKPHRIQPSDKKPSRISVELQGFGTGMEAIMVASGSRHYLIDLGRAFAWLCCAVRPTPSKRKSLSNFDYCVSAINITDQGGVDVAMTLRLSSEEPKGLEVCWHRLFNSFNVVLGGPMSKRSEYVRDEANQQGTFIRETPENQKSILCLVAPIQF